jgi:predicted dehydrogenase
MAQTKVRMAMVGGGEGAFIGAIHRIAARLDNQIELVAGCFSSKAERNAAMAAQLGISTARCYDSYQQLCAAEAQLPPEQRIEFVTIVTPNHLHFPVAKAALLAGFHVLSDKPATLSLDEALQLQALVQQTGLHYGLTHTYAAYPMALQARLLVQQGHLGAVRRVAVSYPQGWLANKTDSDGSAQAQWRLDPARSGVSGCFADIGTHAFQLAEFISVLEVTELCADLATVIDGRQLDDDGSALLRFNNGARGTLLASQVCAGMGNGLQISVYGELGSLSWQQEQPDQLIVQMRGQPQQTWQAGTDKAYLAPQVRAWCRTPAGHPEGYLEAFANIYRDFALALRQPTTSNLAAGIEQAVRGMAFVQAAVVSSRQNAAWVSIAGQYTFTG